MKRIVSIASEYPRDGYRRFWTSPGRKLVGEPQAVAGVAGADRGEDALYRAGIALGEQLRGGLQWLPKEVFDEVFQFILRVATRNGLLWGEKRGVDTAIDADKGYHSKKVVMQAAELGMQKYISFRSAHHRLLGTHHRLALSSHMGKAGVSPIIGKEGTRFHASSPESKKAPRTTKRTGCFGRETSSKLLGQDHCVDDMDDPIAGRDIRLGDVRHALASAYLDAALS